MNAHSLLLSLLVPLRSLFAGRVPFLFYTRPSCPAPLPTPSLEQAMVPFLSYALSALALCPLLTSVSAIHNRKQLQTLQRQAADRFYKNRLALADGGVDVRLNPGVKNITFSNPDASGQYPLHSSLGGRVDFRLAFYVDGTTIPDVDWDVGPSWAGLLPISGDVDETQKVSDFFFSFSGREC